MPNNEQNDSGTNESVAKKRERTNKGIFPREVLASSPARGSATRTVGLRLSMPSVACAQRRSVAYETSVPSSQKLANPQGKWLLLFEPLLDLNSAVLVLSPAGNRTRVATLLGQWSANRNGPCDREDTTLKS